jgi:FkbM family methyltransferase
MFNFASLNLGRVDTLVDIGAGTGAFLRPALAFYKPSDYLAVEMLADRAFDLMQEFHGRHVVCAAVGESKGWAPVLKSEHPDSSSLLPITTEAESLYKIPMTQHVMGSVEVRTLDDICRLLPYDKQIDLMKIDIQGYEARALRGGPETLARTRALIIEILHCPHYMGQSAPAEIAMLLRQQGLRFDRWLTDDWNADRSVRLQGDALYVRD